MAYVPDISGFLKPLGEVASLKDILNSEVPQQYVLKYNENDITEFSTDMNVVLKAEHGFRIKLIVDNRTMSVVTVQNPSSYLKRHYNSRGCVIERPAFVVDKDIQLYWACDRKKGDCYHFIQRYIKIRGNNSPEFILRIWSDRTPPTLAPRKIELIPL